MICQVCFGRKYDFKKDGNSGYFVECKKCHGTGKIVQTNEEWRRTCSAEEFSEWLEEKMTWAAQEQGTFTAKGWAKWLKQPHTEKE